MTKIICGYCGTVEEIEGKVIGNVYFPNRTVYLDTTKYPNFPIKCKHCKCDNDIVIFGEQFCSTVFPLREGSNIDNINANNVIYQTNQNLLKETHKKNYPHLYAK